MVQLDEKATIRSTKVLGMSLPYFAACLVLILASAYLGVLGEGMISALAASMVVGSALMWLGNRIKWFGDFGGGTLLCVSVPAILVYFGVLPESLQATVASWYADSDFLNFLIAGIIAGSLLGMNRKILVGAGLRFAIPVLAAVLTAVGLGALLASLLGSGLRDSLLFVVFPIMGGGVGAGAVPMSQVYADGLGGTDQDYMSNIVPAIIMANILCILIAGVYSALSRRKKQLFVGFNGNGEMLRLKLDPSAVTEPREKPALNYQAIAAGILLAGSAYIAGQVLSSIIPAIHTYAWMILLVALLKIFQVVPSELESSAEHWYQLIARTWVPAVLVWVSFALIDITRIMEVITNPHYLILTISTVAAACLAAGLFGWLARMYFVEASITGGLCMADLGGSGDLAVLGASNRMQLMPFAQMASRLGGAVVLLSVSALMPVFA